MRRAFVAALAVACAPELGADPRVAVRPRGSGADQGLALLYNETICDVTLRDRQGLLHDMRRALPDAEGETTAFSSRNVSPPPIGGTRLAVIAMPPGSYAVVGFRAADDWDPRRSPWRDCKHRTLTQHAVNVPIDIAPDHVSLLALPAGTVDLVDLQVLRAHLNTPSERVRTWAPNLESAATEARVGLVRALRQPHNGFDVYPGCDGLGVTAVVRDSGTRMADVQQYVDHVLAHIGQAHMNQHSIDKGCVTQASAVFVVLSASDVQRAVDSIGEWLVRDDLAGEVDVVGLRPPIIVPQLD